jgi:hypothetical protein
VGSDLAVVSGPFAHREPQQGLEASEVREKLFWLVASVQRSNRFGCQLSISEGNELIEPFRSISFPGKWPKNRLLGQVIAAN